MLTEQTFSEAAIQTLGASEHRMTLGTTILKALVVFVVTCAFAVLGWDRAASVISATSGPSWLLWYMLLIAFSFMAIANPRLAPRGSLGYPALMGSGSAVGWPRRSGSA
jgi:hypothetical protein